MLSEEGFTLGREHEVESLFAIANGYVGNRGSLAEGSPLSAPATFAAGIFNRMRKAGHAGVIRVARLDRRAPPWIEERPLSMEHGQILEHRRFWTWRMAFSGGVRYAQMKTADLRG